MTNREQINRRDYILNMSESKEAKIRSLIAIGFGAFEAKCVVEDFEATHPVADKYSQRFGVEIECLVSRATLLSNCANNGIAIESEGYNHIDRTDRYKIVSDGSVMGENSNEVVSPILQGEQGFDSLEGLCNALTASGAKVNKTCGLHVHIDARGMSENARVMVREIYSAIEPIIDGFMPLSRRGDNNRYCRRVYATSCIYREVIALGRYYKLNICSYESHGSIEFRHHSGTVEYEKISMWVKFCMSLMDLVKNRQDEIQKLENASCVDDLFFLDDDVKEYYKARTAHFAQR